MSRPNLGRAAGVAWRLPIAVLAALPVCSLFVARGVSSVPVAAGLLVGLAALRPAEAWLVTAAIAPLGAWIGHSIGFGSSLTEPIVLAFLAGWLVHETVRAGATTTGTKKPGGDRGVQALLLLLGLTVLASLLVRLVAHHLTVDFPGAYVRALVRFLWHDYFGGPSRFRAPVGPGVRLLAGIALAAASLSLVRRHPRLAIGGARAVAAGAALAALAALVPLTAGLVAGGWSAAFPKGLAALRLSSVGRDVNAAGSFYALALGPAAGLILADRRLRPLWGVLAGLILAGLWMTGSRAGLAASALVAVLMTARLATHARGRTVAVAASAAAVLVLVLGSYLYTTANVRTPARVAFEWRVEHGTRALRMFADHPLFGAGVGRYYALSREYASPGWPLPGNSHNNFLQILAELGLVGLVLSAALVGLALWRAWRASGTGRPGPLLACVAGGLLAFVVTWLAGHPLLVFEAAVPFWLTLGLVAGMTPGSGSSPSRWRRAVTVALACAIGLSVVPRARAAIRDADLSGAGMGFSSVRTDARGQRFRWMASRGRVFVPASALRVAIPFRSPSAPAAIKVVVDGKLVARLAAGPRWADVVFDLPRVPDTRCVPVDLRAVVVRSYDGGARHDRPAGDRVQVGLPRVVR